VLGSLEESGADLGPPLALLAGQDVELDEAELNGALRRSLLLLAAGGEPEHGLVLDGRAVVALAAELDAPERRLALRAGLEALRAPAAELPAAREALAGLLADDETAWRAFACALLANELAAD
jgi:hypothetical protein